MIELRNVHKAFGDHKVLRGVDLSIPKGKITVIIGPSGTGKSVTLRHIIGLTHPDQGDVFVNGQQVSALEPEDMPTFRRQFGMVFQHAALFDSMSVFDNVAFPLREARQYTEAEIAVVVGESLEAVGLPYAADKMPSELSGGMRKRVGLARAIVLRPQIILYDEPTTGLDPVMTESIDDLILQTQRSYKGTSVVISHDIPSTMRIADQIAMLNEGTIIACGTPAEIQASQHPVVKHFLDVAQGR